MKTIFKWTAAILLIAIAALTWWGWAPDTDPAAMRAKYGGGSSQFVDMGSGLTLHIRDDGPKDAPAIILLHGSNGSLHTWEGWTKALVPDYRVIRIDLPGHGLTGIYPKGDYSRDGFVAVVDAAAAKLGLKRFTIGGNSMGGGVAWAYTLAHPEKVAGLVLVDAAGAPVVRRGKPPLVFQIAQNPMLAPLLTHITPRSMVRAGVEASVADPSKIIEGAVDLYWELLRYPGNRAATVKRQSGGYPAAVTEAQIGAIGVPTLVMWGAKDATIPLASGQWFAKHINRAELVTYPDLGHIPMEEDPQRTVNDLEMWLAVNQAYEKVREISK